MIKLVEMDENVTFSNQMEGDVGAVILINKFNVSSEDVDQFLKAWASGAEFMKKQPGFISAQLHRGIGGSSVFVIYAVWESTELYRRAFNNSEFQSRAEKYPANTVVSSHFKKIAVPGICVD